MGFMHIIYSNWYGPNNPGAANFFVSIFHSFKAGIADAISSFKWRKQIIYENKQI